MAKSERQQVEIIKTAWKIEESVQKLERSEKTCMQLLQDAKKGPHKSLCTGDWLKAAKQLLELNNVNIQQFTRDIRELIEHGRGKGRCIMICGESNCGKSFILMPLTEIYDTFLCPSNNKFNWVGANTKDVVLLNDLNYSEEAVMKWMPF